MAKLNEAITMALQRIKASQLRLAALDYAVRGLLGRQVQHQRALTEYTSVRLFLSDELIEAYLAYFQLVVVRQGPELRVAKRLAYRQFVRDGRDVMRYLDMDGIAPREWLTDSARHEFRAEIEAAMQEGESGDKAESDRA